MNFSTLLRRFATGAAIVLGLGLASPAVSAPVVIPADLTLYGGTSGVGLGCQGGGCVVADDIFDVSNSGDNYILGVYGDLFGFDDGSLTIWDKYDVDTDTYRFDRISVDAEEKSGSWTLNSGATGSFDSSQVVGFIAKLGPYSVFLNFLDPGIEAGDEFLVETLKAYAKAILPEDDFGTGKQFKGGGFSHLVVVGTLTTVPAPAALPLAAAGFAVFGLMGWRKHRRAV